MNLNNFKWWYAVIGMVAYLLSFLLNSQFTSLITPLFENSNFNQGGVLNVSMFVFSGILCLIGFRVISRGMISQNEFGLHLKDYRRIIIIGGLIGLTFFVLSELIEMNSADLIEAGEQVMSDFNVGKNLTNDIILLLSIGLFAPVVEEIIFRGGIFNPLYKGLKKIQSIPSNVGLIIALIVSSYLFMSIHGGSGQDAQIYLLFILGAFAAIAMYLTKSLFGAILVHAVNNNLVFIYALLKLDKTGTSHTVTLIIVSILCFFACIPLAYFFGKILPQKK